LNRGWRFCRFSRVVDRVASCWSLVGPAPWFCPVFGRYWTTNGLQFPGCLAGSCLPPWNRLEKVSSLFEQYRQYRRIFTDGRTFSENLQKEPDRSPMWWGYSVGRWDGAVFVVKTLGFNDKTWLDDRGHPHSEALDCVTEPSVARVLVGWKSNSRSMIRRLTGPWTISFQSS
jgi:hypothetical protein